jgi:hypothetical protein
MQPCSSSSSNVGHGFGVRRTWVWSLPTCYNSFGFVFHSEPLLRLIKQYKRWYCGGLVFDRCWSSSSLTVPGMEEGGRAGLSHPQHYVFLHKYTNTHPYTEPISPHQHEHAPPSLMAGSIPRGASEAATDDLRHYVVHTSSEANSSFPLC